MNFLKIDDFNVSGKTILVRVDLNSSLNENKEPQDNIKIKYNSITIKQLSDLGAKVVVMSHQGRAGDDDLISMEKHAKLLSKHTEKEIKYIDDIFGTYAKNSIKSMKNGDIILLENVRFNAEENLLKENQHKTHLVSQLSPLLDYYVNDAFAVNHRTNASLIGFPEVLPSFAGRILQRELEVLTKIMNNPKRPSVLLLGGAKTNDSIKVIKQMLFSNAADIVLTSGLVSLLFLVADGVNIGNATHNILIKKSNKDIKLAKKILEKFKNKILMPLDFAICVDNKRIELPISNLPIDYPILDIGEKTIKKYKDIILNAGNVIANGPAGVFEKKQFEKGTQELFEAMHKSKAFDVFGGGHTALALEKFGLLEKSSHVSTGGGAFILYISGEKLPGVNALINSAKKHHRLITRIK
ncbi:MAG: phosphoglycerate kinase [Candidatus Aenigmarchaeota archaeon ex4484_52]|nr:MAG: phosphoglycerate kinase [Candidatus Aenigmarchaeota archaeon ex4484_52]